MTETSEIVRRWNAPPKWGYVKENPDELVEMGGDLRGGIEEGLSPETFERIREGRLCLICKEPQSVPFPEVCEMTWTFQGSQQGCGFPIRDQQLRYLEILDRGEAVLGRDYGSKINLDEELDRLDDELERDNWAEHPTSGIIIPRSFG